MGGRACIVVGSTSESEKLLTEPHLYLIGGKGTTEAQQGIVLRTIIVNGVDGLETRWKFNTTHDLC